MTDLHILTAAHVATMATGVPYGMIADGGVAVENGRIIWVGPIAGLPDHLATARRKDYGDRLITPALIDCHTHIVFGGDRAREFEMRLEGASYEEIARAGGGIVSTVTATRKATLDELVAGALTRVDAMIAEGVTTIEVKSGYGLNVETELNMLRAARRIAEARPIRVKTSFLGAHAVPAEYAGRSGAYIAEVCLPSLRAAHAEGLVDAVDGFCEGIAFTPDEIRVVFEEAKALGLPVKLHAEQLSDLGGARLAAEYGAMSADHLEYLNNADAVLLAEKGVVAVILPGAFYTLRETQRPPLAALRAAGARMAVATDCNPGSSPISSMLLTLNMCCTLFRMTPEEALTGATANAAAALGLDDCGVIAVGMRADLSVWDAQHPAELAYRIGFNPLHERVFAG
jgi:imidazolonepropionase